MILFMSNATRFAAVLLFISNLLSCGGYKVGNKQYPTQCRNAARKALDLIQSRNESDLVVAYEEAQSEVQLEKKYSIGQLKSSVSDFCGIKGGLQRILDRDNELNHVNMLVFQIDVVQNEHFDTALLQIPVLFPANITLISCHRGSDGQYRVKRGYLDYLDSDKDSNSYSNIDANFMIEKNYNQQSVPMLIVLEGDKSKRKLPDKDRPYVELSKPQPIQTNANYSSQPCGLDVELCCLDYLMLDVKTQLSKTKLGRLNIVAPRRIQIHFCRGGCLDEADNIVTVGCEQNCCTPMGFHSIPIVVREANGQLSNKKLEGVDVSGCICPETDYQDGKDQLEK